MEAEDVLWSAEEYLSHCEAARLLDEIREKAFNLIAESASAGEKTSEKDVQDFILKEYIINGLVSSIAPTVAFGKNSREPHHRPRKDALLKPDDIVLVDVFAKKDGPGGIYSDITWMGYTGKKIPGEYLRIFDVVAGARDAVIDKLARSFREGENVRGYELDDTAREFIKRHGLGDYFIHRTGHSLGRELVGSGVHPDNYKSREERLVVPGSGFTVEPGIYLNNYGVRSEVDVYLGVDGPVVTTQVQVEIIKLI